MRQVCFPGLQALAGVTYPLRPSGSHELDDEVSFIALGFLLLQLESPLLSLVGHCLSGLVLTCYTD